MTRQNFRSAYPFHAAHNVAQATRASVALGNYRARQARDKRRLVALVIATGVSVAGFVACLASVSV